MIGVLLQSLVSLGFGLSWEVKEREERSREVTAKRVGLVSPVEAVWSSCVLVEVVLGLAVVFEDLYKVFVVQVFFGL